jgi:integrase
VPKVRLKSEIVTEADEDEASSVVRSLTQEQATNFLAAARDVQERRYTALWYVLLTGGLRPGEALALKWRHVDFEKGEVRVRANLTRLGLKGGWKLKQPKTENSRREVPLPSVTMQELRAWKKQQAEERLAAGPEWQDHGFVFTTHDGAPLGSAKQVHDSFRRVCERGKLPGSYGPEPAKPRHGPTARRAFTPAFRVYDLRHSSVTLALLNGEDLLKVSRRHGHKSPMFTAERYGHVKAADTRSTADLMERLFAHS